MISTADQPQPRSIRPTTFFISTIGMVAFVIASLAFAGPAVNDQADADVPVRGRSLADAKIEARSMHELYSITLDVMHHRYFHDDRAVVPARAMEDVFETYERTSNVQAKWIAANLRAMSVDHEPKTEFEKRAAREIGAGKEFIETVDDGFYRRAGAIPLASSCVSCHSGLFQATSKKPRFAGLIISVPLNPERSKSE